MTQKLDFNTKLTRILNYKNNVNNYISARNKPIQAKEMNNNKQINKQHHNEK